MKNKKIEKLKNNFSQGNKLLDNFLDNIKKEYEKKNKIKYKKYNFENKERDIANNIINEINKIDIESAYNKNKSNEIYENIKNTEFKFGEEISNYELNNFIKNAVNYINFSCTKKEKKGIKKFFGQKVNQYIINNFSKKGIRDKVMRDMLISYFFKKRFIKFDWADSLFLFENVSNVPLNEIQVNKIKLNKEFLKEAINKKIIINNYLKVCEKYVNEFDSTLYTVNQLSKILEKHIDKMNIYFAELPKNICGLTIYTGDIIISAKYLNGIYSNSSTIKLECLACIFLTILHELAHCLTRIIKGKKNKQNPFSNSVDLNDKKIRQIKIEPVNSYMSGEENKITKNFSDIMKELNNNFKKKNIIDKKKINESGSYFDLNMFYNKKYREITKNEAEYFLNLENYKVNEKKYKENLKNLFDKRKNVNQMGVRFKQTDSLIDDSLSIGKCAREYRNSN